MKNLVSILISAVMVFCFLSCEENEGTLASISKDISNQSKLATFIKSDGSILYFDTYQDLVDSLKLNDFQTTTYSSTETTTKATWDANVNITFYKDTKYRDTKKAFSFYYPNQITGAGIADLSSIGMLNMISSLKISLFQYSTVSIRASVTLWDQKFYKGHSVTWIVQPGTNEINIPNLYNIGRGRLMENLHWNDAAQSVQMGF